MASHIERREDVLRALIEELLGPSPQGDPIDCTVEIAFDDAAAAYVPRRQAGSGEEIVMRDSPVKRYGVGVLCPPEVPMEEAAPGPAEQESGDGELPSEERKVLGEPDALLQAGADGLQKAAEKVSGERRADDYDFDLATVNAYRPSTMAVSFLAELPVGSQLVVRATGGRYARKRIRVGRDERVWWLRSPVVVEATFSADALLLGAGGRVIPDGAVSHDTGPLQLEIVAYPRARSESRRTLVTLCLVNRSESEVFDEGCLFQSRFTAAVESADGQPCVLPYPDPEGRARDDEEDSLELLYRHSQTFAVGHGCAADWKGGSSTRAAAVVGEPLPVVEVPNISADVWLEAESRKLEVSMAALAGLVEGSDGRGDIKTLLGLYEAWIGRQRRGLESDEAGAPLAARYQAAARRHLAQCEHALTRMRDGLDFLAGDEDAQYAFQLANEAVLLQQLRTTREPRRLTYDATVRQLVFDKQLDQPDPLRPPPGRGQWRPFQIAFVLACVRSVADPQAPDREDVELIWFPTGGGKTEAYLALTAFSLLYRRLKGRDDAGVDVLMRYTLRLLTAQQFQRASALICALDVLRQRDEQRLGEERFSIGLWLGAGVSPNTREEARAALRALKKGDEENKFVVLRCPWCAGEMGPVRYRQRNRQALTVCGYTEAEGTVRLHCYDAACEFHDALPLFVIDEDIYDIRPSLVIGTVDKFAQLAWEPRARALFGLASDGTRLGSPPNLIIQDELHLISGPLGSMVGIYEGAINALCMAGAEDGPPKIIASTATIRRYERQVCDLYARDNVHLFPPPGLDAGNSFFARHARDEESGELLPGRKYVGIHAPGLSSVQTAQVRTFSALLQAPATFAEEERDPWWTLMVFFNSLRELGTSLSLLQSDIPDYLWAIRTRMGLSAAESRRLRDFLELTGRLRNDEVPKAMERLEVETTSAAAMAVDVCLASNIIEVGIDIDRLSLMCVVGQPKTTSQYIQVTGRVGRTWWERPALVATIYGVSKPRDRSHFEKFRSYHERLYAQVEPTSVTPFSPPVADRALHAVVASYVRQAGPEAVAASPYPFPEELVEDIREILEARVAVVDPEEEQRMADLLDARITQWKAWQRTGWRRQHRDDDVPLLRRAGEYASTVEAQLSWSTPTSLREVDAECEATVTRLYLREGSDGDV